jgi:uncharacterized membrane protein required for colicin V production
MTLDLWILAAAALFGAYGAWTGAIKQVSHWIALIAAFFGSKPLAVALAPMAAARLGWSPTLTTVALTAVLFPLISLAVGIVSQMIINAVVPGKQRNAPDRVAGFVLGAGKAGVIAWVALSVAVMFEAPLAKAAPKAAASLQGSHFAAFTRDHGLFGKSGPAALTQLRDVAAGKIDPAKAKSLLEDPNLKAVLTDPALKTELAKGDPAALLRDPRIRKLLADPQLLEKLRSLAPAAGR